LWEIAVKCSIGKLEIADPATRLPAWIVALGARVLPIEARHAYLAYSLPLLHRDPFDRMLVAQAAAEDLVLVTSDEAIRQYPIRWLW
jgi:PIN domain nuclease of toxin-antitoxin system